VSGKETKDATISKFVYFYDAWTWSTVHLFDQCF
jgi:hypothetical protein